MAGLVAFHQQRQLREPRVLAAARAKILLAGNSTEIESLDPDLATGVPEHKVITAMFEGLVSPAGDDPDAEVPGAAVSWTQEAFTKWTFKLQPHGKWSDGVPVTARDFVFAYQRILSPDLAGDYSSMLYGLKNGEAFNKGELKDFSQVGVKAVDDLTLELTLKGPMPYLPGMLKHYAWFPIPQHVVEKHGPMTSRFNPWAKPQNIVSNGPFKLKEWRFTHYLAVERNPHYWDAGNVKLNGIHFFPITSDTTEERAFQDGQLHLTELVPLSRIPYYRSERSSVYRADRTLCTYFFRLNVTRKPLDDPRVRRALSLGLDRVSLVENVLRAGQEAAYGLTPPGCAKGYETPHLLTMDAAEGRRLLAEAGFPDGKGFPSLPLLLPLNNASRTVCEAAQEMWKKNLGIKVSILNQDWQVYLDSMRKLDFAISFAGWAGDYPDPSTFLNLWRTGDGNNNTGYASAAFDQLINNAEITADASARMQLLQDAEKMVLTDLPIVPIYWRVHYYLRSPLLENYRGSILEHRAYKAIDLKAE